MSTDDSSPNKAEPSSIDNMDEDESNDGPPGFAAALGLHRVGSALPAKQPQQPIQVLNARGMPARIRKKNKLFFDDNIVNERPQRASPMKKPLSKPTTPSNSMPSSPLASSVTVAATGEQQQQQSHNNHQQKDHHNHHHQPNSSSPQKSFRKGMKKRKALVISRYMRLKEEARKKAFSNSVTKGSSSPDNSPSTAAAAKASCASITQQTMTKMTPTSSGGTEMVDRKIFQRIGLRLRNLLKLPKAHKWVSYEWFYSYIDKPLFDGENDFQICLKESFPQLKTRMLNRGEWTRVRKLMGKPRRCSQAFFAEERLELERRRNKIRMLQARMSAEAGDVRDLPAEIPLPLSVATKVTARLRHPQDGIYTGSIAAVDSVSSSYRITFDRVGLGTHSVPDFEVLANDYCDMVSVTSLTQDLRPKAVGGGPQSQSNTCARRVTGGVGPQHISQHHQQNALLSSTNKNDPLLGSEIFNNSKLKSMIYPKESIGGFQLKLLELVIRTKKSLAVKRQKMLRLKNMNTEAEMCRSFDEPFPEDYQRRYASIVIGMEKLNRDMQEYLSQIQNYTRDLTKEPIVAAMLAPSYLREKCKEMAVETVQKNNQAIKDPSMLRLITDLATILWVASNMSSDDQNSHVMRVLEVCLQESKSRLDPENVETFQKNVHVHMRHIELDAKKMSK